MTDREAFIQFVLAVGFSLAVMVTFAFISTLITNPGSKPEEKYKVVDHYGTCAVVRYTDDSQRWHYFLDCREVR